MAKLPIMLAVAAAVPLSALAQSVSRQPSAKSGSASSPQGISLQTFEARHERKVMAADTDGDGRVSRAEFVAAAGSGKRDRADRFVRIDRNGDGFVDKAEIDAMLARRFKRLDANGDGQVTPQERAAGRGGRSALGKASDDS